ncbi:hypothetical protein ABMA27_016855 [Loxostege sticticalis]|uniref:Lipase n=1 Tax=Loxostege sticticalis TaxID=481309 RepID=A0ABR3I3Y1_LOXSC
MFMIVFSSLLALSEAGVGSILQSDAQKNTPEDGRRNFSQLSREYGHECEEYDVTTEDGYILKLFHITGNEDSTPVLLMHGILDTADAFIIRGNISIAINLAEAGNDVWAWNVRGNIYSRRHETLSPDKDKHKFWDFSFHEMGTYDLPATIDFILEKTGKENLSAIGHSMGTSIAYILGSTRPEYNQKISVFISLAPIAYLTHVSPAVKATVKLWPAIKLFFQSLGYEEVLQNNSTATELIQFICTQGELSYDICWKGVASALAGDDPEEMEEQFFDVFIRHFPAGTSRKTFGHFVQIARTGRFAQYNYGAIKNRLVYKSADFPDYNLSNATMPIVLIAAKNDGFSGIKDVERLKGQLPNVVDYHVMEREQFNHLDFIYGRHLNVYMTPLLRDFLSKFS